MATSNLKASIDGRLINNNKPIAYESEIHNAYDSTRAYKTGDIVTEHGIVYECHINITRPESFQINKWDAKDEQGGRLHDVHKRYLIGDIIVENNSVTSKVWRAIRNTSGHFTPVNWVQLSEQGGVEWTSTGHYIRGDVVSRTDILPVKVYVATHANQNDQPPQTGSSTNWQALDTSMHNAQEGGDQDGDGHLSPGTYGGPQHCPWKSSSSDAPDHPRTPNTIGEYPSTHINSSHSETIGATWLVSGLGYGSNGDKNQYKMTTGNLKGLMVRDGDQLTWVGGAHGNETWFQSPVPEVIGERGGLKWISTKIYIEGDVVGKDGIQYVSIRTSTNKDPSNQIGGMDAYWSVAEEGGGLVWDQFKTYPEMAIVSIKEVWPSGLSFVEQFLSKDDDNKGNNPLDHNDTHWDRFDAVKYISKSITFTVGGSRSDFTGSRALYDALLFVSRFVAVDGAIITLEVAYSHTVDYEMRFYGVNLSSVKVDVSSNRPLSVQLNNELFIYAFKTKMPQFLCGIRFTGTTNKSSIITLDQSDLKFGIKKELNINVHSSVDTAIIYATTGANISMGLSTIKASGGNIKRGIEAVFNSNILALGYTGSTHFDGGRIIQTAYIVRNGSKLVIAYAKIINITNNSNKDAYAMYSGSTITEDNCTVPSSLVAHIVSKYGIFFKN